jgi:protein CpxP
MTGRVKAAMAAVAVTMAVVSGGASLFAQGGPDGPGRRGFGGRGFGGPGFARHGGFGLALRGLDLTDEQRTQVKSIFEQHRDELRKSAERVGAAFRAQREAVSAIPVDEGAIRATSAALAAAQTDSAVLQARVHGEVYQILTPEQQQKAQQLRTERQQRMKQARQRWQERRQQRQQAQPKQ